MDEPIEDKVEPTRPTQSTPTQSTPQPQSTPTQSSQPAQAQSPLSLQPSRRGQPPTTPFRPSLTSESTRKVSTKKKLGKKYWQGIAAIVGIVTLVVTAIGLIKKDPAPTEGDISITTTSQTGCNIAGEGNTVDCPITIEPLPTKSLAGIQTKWTGTYVWYFDGLEEGLPTPPDYAPENWNGHCNEWLPWLMGQENFYVAGAGVLLMLASGQDEQVVVTDISAKSSGTRSATRNPQSYDVYMEVEGMQETS